MISRAIASLLVSIVLSGCAGAGAGSTINSGGTDDTIETRHTIEYQATWTGGTTGSVNYWDATGGLQVVALSSVSSPWSLSIDDFPSSLIASVGYSGIPGDEGTVRLIVDGIERDTATGTSAVALYDFLPFLSRKQVFIP